MPNIGDTLVSKTTGEKYTLVKQLGKGGEGTVYTTNNPDVVIKVYHPERRTEEIERKLLCMLKHPLDPKVGTDRLLVAWPLDVVYENGAFVGYVMPLVKDTHPIYIVCRNNEKHVKDCHEIFPKYDWRYSLMVAYHLALVVAAVHKHGYIIGDMNSNNIVIHGDGTPTILDVDSFDITDPVTKEHFPCRVGICEFLAPELQGRNLNQAQFTKETDEFALAVHIFILLMNNYHPFTMREIQGNEFFSGNVHTLTKPKASSPVDQRMLNIVNGNCPYIQNIPGYTLPVGAVHFHMLPTQIQNLFRNTFEYTDKTAIQNRTKRTSATLWRDHLFLYYQRSLDASKTGKEPDLIRCSVNREHFYLRSRNHCDFCEALKSSVIPRTVSSVIPWAVSIVSTTTSQTYTTTSSTIQAGSTAYVHFTVTNGPAGSQTVLRYSWTGPGGSGTIKPMSDTFGVTEKGTITLANLAAGSYTVTIYDSASKELAKKQFSVANKPSQTTQSTNNNQHRGFWATLFGW